MIAINIKPIKGSPYSTSLIDDKFEKLINEKKAENKPAIIKKLCKEFNVTEEEIQMYWTIKEEKTK